MSGILQELDRDRERMNQWFARLHAHPELSMQEEQTAAFIAETLRGFNGLDVVTGIGKHGVVASLTVGDGRQAIGLRADFDALPIQEVNTLKEKSHPGQKFKREFIAFAFRIKYCKSVRQSLYFSV